MGNDASRVQAADSPAKLRKALQSAGGAVMALRLVTCAGVSVVSSEAVVAGSGGSCSWSRGLRLMKHRRVVSPRIRVPRAGFGTGTLRCPCSAERRSASTQLAPFAARIPSESSPESWRLRSGSSLDQKEAEPASRRLAATTPICLEHRAPPAAPRGSVSAGQREESPI